MVESEKDLSMFCGWRLKTEEGAMSQACWLLLGKGKETDSSLEPPEGTQSCRHLDCSPKWPF